MNNRTPFTISLPTTAQRIAASKMLDEVKDRLGFTSRNQLLLTLISADEAALAEVAKRAAKRHLHKVEKLSEPSNKEQKRVTPLTVYVPRHINRKELSERLDAVALAAGWKNRSQWLYALLLESADVFERLIHPVVAAQLDELRIKLARHNRRKRWPSSAKNSAKTRQKNP